MSTIRLVLAGVLIASALAAPAAIAGPLDEERYYMSHGSSQAADPATAAAEAHEDYLMSYGAPEPQRTPSDGSWLPVALGSVAAALVLLAAGATVHRRRHRTIRGTPRIAI